MPDYTTWFTDNDVVAKLTNAGISLRSNMGAAYVGRISAGVVAEIARRTHRQFAINRDTNGAALSEIRYFDGSGMGVQEVDECVSLTSVAVIGYVATSPALTLTNAYLRTDNNYPNTLIEIFQSSLPSVTFTYLDRFAQGRQNIKVDAVWGYGSTIPADLWEAGAGEAAARLAGEIVYDPTGRLQEWKEADATSEKHLLALPGEAAGWHSTFECRIHDYTRDVARNLRKLRAPMI